MGEKTIKDYLVENLRKAVEKVSKEYNGTTGQQVMLYKILETQAMYIEENGKSAFFTQIRNETYDGALQKLDNVKVKQVALERLIPGLTETPGYPTDPKVGAEFEAIAKASFYAAVDSRAKDLGRYVEPEVAASNVAADVAQTQKLEAAR